ncbi:hypothetical protein [Agaribacterium sp. ZY112]|uniref:hypothetical protein n=1 Tax=Agaribacterium sp. ZY112 TaxID=3233574 RepID=UPI0035237DC0
MIVSLLLRNSAVAIGVKSLGLAFVFYLAHAFQDEQRLGSMLLVWGYVVFFQGAVFTPLAHYCVTTSSQMPVKSVTSLALVCLLLSVFFLDGRPFYLLGAFMLLNLVSDYGMIVDRKYIQLSYLTGLKNLFGLMAIYLGLGIELVFLSFALGEATKTLFSLPYFFRPAVGVKLKLSGFVRYSAFLFCVGSYYVVIRTMLACIDVGYVVQFELFLRLAEVVLVGVTSGVMPIFLTAIREGGKSKNVVVFFSLGGATLLSLVVLLSSLIFGGESFAQEFYNLNLNGHFNLVLAIVLILSVFMVFASYIRKEVAASAQIGWQYLIPPSLVFTFFYVLVSYWHTPPLISAFLALLIVISCECALSLRALYAVRSKCQRVE